MSTLGVRPLTLDDYEAVHALWSATPGIGLNESDRPEEIAMYLDRNPGMSAVATLELEIVGAVLCGHDGRRGYIHHLAVAESHRGRGVARKLLEWCRVRLAQAGIPKANGFLYVDNELGASFWRHNGWIVRTDLHLVQRRIE